MRTKLVLMAMALPALFAACTSDEFVEPAQGDLNGRALLNGLTVNVDQDAETRFAWGNYAWKFEAGDQFGAALTDPTAGTVQDGQLLGNYIFSKGDNGYTTTSQMYEGIYFFYSYPEFQGKATRDLVKFDLGVQKADLTKPEEVINNTQLFFSPLYDIKAKTVDAKLPLTFYPYWSVAAFKIKNNTGKAFNISQIVLKGSFQTKGEISPKKINDAKLVYKIADGDTEYSLPKDVKLGELMAETDFAKETDDKYTKPAAATSIALNCGNYELANGKEIIAYMSVPAGAQTNLTAEIMVNAEGVSKKIVVNENGGNGTPATTENIASKGISTLKFLRGGTKAVFGFETDGKTMKALSVAAKNLQDANGYFVDNKTDLLAVINANRGGIEVFNMGDLAIDNEIAKALTLYTAAGVKFANPIEVKAEGDVTIDKTEFAGGVTIKSGNVTFEKNVVLSANAKMDVAGGKVILKGEGYKTADSSIEVNNGELVVSETNMQIAEIVMNNGTLTLNGGSQTIGSGKIENIMFNVIAGKKVNLNVALDAENGTGTLTIDDNGILKSNVTTTVSKDNVVSIATSKSLTNEGTVVNNGEVGGAGTLVNSGTITNAYKISNVNNSGFIINTDGWYSVVSEATTSGEGWIENTVGGKVTAASTTPSKVYRVYDGVTDPVTVSATGEFAVLKNVTFTKNATIAPTVIMLGTTEIKGGTVTVSTEAVIGVTDDYKALAAKVLKTTWNTTTNKVADYNKKNVEVRVYESAILATSASYEAAEGVTLLNKGTVNLPSSATEAQKNAWTPNAAQ